MPERIKILFSTRERPHIPLSNKNKLFIVIIIFILSYLSGKIPFINDISATKKEQVLAETTILDDPTEITPELSSGETEQIQIKQIAIGQKKIYVPDNEWGVAKKIDSHTYTLRLKPDKTMGTPQEILAVLNTYRRQNGRGALEWNSSLASFANTRAVYFSQIGKLDNHAGFLDYVNNQDGFRKLGFASLGENSSIGFTLQAVHIIEWVYSADAEHNNNQLNNDWHYVGIGVNGNATDLVFAGDTL